MAELRSAIFIDQLQPQTMCYLGTWIRGRLPRSGMAAAVIEVAPGLDIEPLTDVALKHTRLQAGILVVERQFGYLEIHSRSTEAVRSASAAVLDALGRRAGATRRGRRCWPRRSCPASTPSTPSSSTATSSARWRSPGESLFVLEMQPASYAILATNEAEKAARIKVVDYRMIGATGRVYLSGDESDVRAAAEAAERALEAAHERSDARETCASCCPRRCARPAARAAVLREVLPPGGGAAPSRDRPPRGERGASERTPTSTAFVRAVAALCEDPDADARRCADGRHGFRLVAARARPVAGRLRFALRRAPGHRARRDRVRIERGAVTERTVVKAAADGARAGARPAAVLTPLARDKARALGVEIERER